VAYTSEIEKLERRWAENPKGRNFAPLADAYRKAGEVDKAIELCRSGLELHPDYVSAHIVYGRCLVDKKDDPGADQVFRHVLELDPENILALRVLSEIGERSGRFDEATEWLNKLLLADPMNGDAAESLARVRGKAAAAAAAQPPEPIATEDAVAELLPDPALAGMGAVGTEPLIEPEPPTLGEPPAFDPSMAEAPTKAMTRPDFHVERASADAAGKEPVSAPAPDLEVFDGNLDFGAVANESTVAEGLQVDEPVEVAPDEAAPIEGLARTQYEGSGMFKLPADPSPEPEVDETPEPLADLPLIMPDDLEPLPPRRSTPATPAPAPPPPAPRLSIPQLIDDDGAADTASLSQVEPILTETMAELYLRQGHKDDAVRVYQALLAQRPGDGRLQRRLAELTAPSRAAAGGQSAGAFLKGILSARPGAPPVAAPVAVPVAAPVEEPPVDIAATSEASALEAAFANVPQDVEPPEPAPGSPTRPASDSISLDSVFGDEGGRGSIPSLPSLRPAQPPPVADTAKPAGGGFSFDDFFGAPASPGAAAAPTNAPGPDDSGGRPSGGQKPPRPSGRQARAGEPEEDLDQFQAWLKGLKS
jgi:tetratricopeptide (TPR) repeat protein